MVLGTRKFFTHTVDLNFGQYFLSILYENITKPSNDDFRKPSTFVVVLGGIEKSMSRNWLITLYGLL